MQNWLNIFTAVRNANQFDANQQQQQFEDKLAARAEDRTQQQFDTARASQVTQGAFGAFSNMVDSIDSNPNIAEADRPAAYASAFDRIAPALQASGYDTKALSGLRDQLVANPSSAGDILAGLQSTGGASQPNLQPAYDANGNAVFINPRTGRPAARGYQPAQTVLGQGRLEVSQGNLSERQRTDDLGYQHDRSAAQSQGRAEGTATANAPQAAAAIDTQLSGVNNAISVLDNTEHYLSTQPQTDNLITTNARRLASHVPGTPEADYSANLEQLRHALSLYDLRSLRQSGLTLGRTNLAEFQAASQAVANLSLNQTVQQQRQAVAAVRSYLEHVQQSLTDERTHNQALANGAVSGTRPAAGATPAAPAAPAQRQPAQRTGAADPRARQPGESLDAYLARLGL